MLLRYFSRFTVGQRRLRRSSLIHSSESALDPASSAVSLLFSWFCLRSAAGAVAVVAVAAAAVVVVAWPFSGSLLYCSEDSSG